MIRLCRHHLYNAKDKETPALRGTDTGMPGMLRDARRRAESRDLCAAHSFGRQSLYLRLG